MTRLTRALQEAAPLSTFLCSIILLAKAINTVDPVALVLGVFLLLFWWVQYGPRQ